MFDVLCDSGVFRCFCLIDHIVFVFAGLAVRRNGNNVQLMVWTNSAASDVAVACHTGKFVVQPEIVL